MVPNTSETKLSAILAGKPQIVSDQFMDQLDIDHPGHEIRTALNRDRVGVLDAYVAFIGKPPAGYTYLPDGHMVASSPDRWTTV